MNNNLLKEFFIFRWEQVRKSRRTLKVLENFLRDLEEVKELIDLWIDVTKKEIEKKKHKS